MPDSVYQPLKNPHHAAYGADDASPTTPVHKNGIGTPGAASTVQTAWDWDPKRFGLLADVADDQEDERGIEKTETESPADDRGCPGPQGVRRRDSPTTEGV